MKPPAVAPARQRVVLNCRFFYKNLHIFFSADIVLCGFYGKINKIVLSGSEKAWKKTRKRKKHLYFSETMLRTARA